MSPSHVTCAGLAPLHARPERVPSATSPAPHPEPPPPAPAGPFGSSSADLDSPQRWRLQRPRPVWPTLLVVMASTSVRVATSRFLPFFLQCLSIAVCPCAHVCACVLYPLVHRRAHVPARDGPRTWTRWVTQRPRFSPPRPLRAVLGGGCTVAHAPAVRGAPALHALASTHVWSVDGGRSDRCEATPRCGFDPRSRVSDAERLFAHLFVWRDLWSFWGNAQSLRPRFTWGCVCVSRLCFVFFFFCRLNCMSSSCILDISPLSEMRSANTFSRPVGSLSIIPQFSRPFIPGQGKYA